MTGKINYYQRLLALYLSYRRRDTVVAAPPLRLWVEISSRCNLRCPVCPNKELAQSQKGDMAWPLFKKVIDEARGFAFEINLHHRGETLLHPEAGRYINYAASRGIFSKLHTNGTLLDREMSAEILASGLQRLSISFDGFSAAVYEKNRAGASFEQVTENISGFLQQRRQLQKKTPRLAIEVIELCTSRSEEIKQRKFVRDFKKLGLDELVLKKAHNWAGHLGITSVPRKFSACTFPWNALVVFFNGDVSPCAQDFFGSCRLGNAAADSLLEIWNGLSMQKLRQAFSSGQITEFQACSGCDRVGRSTLGGIPREYLKRMLFKHMP
jgi:radical SAM protein with 4Fe4S-binding SPASM domain